MAYFGAVCVCQCSKPSHHFCEQGSSLLEGFMQLALSFYILCGVCVCVRATWMSASSHMPVLELSSGIMLRVIFHVNVLFVLIQSSMLADMKYSNSW